jgi:hypothetical protein
MKEVSNMRYLSDMVNRPRVGWLLALSIAVVEALSLAAYGQSTPGSGTTSSSDSLLPRSAVVPKSVVNRFFPEVSQEASTGQNSTAVGKPKATRSVIYVNSNSSKKVTITVDQYVSSSEASSAYQEAVQRSKSVPGFKPVAAPDLGANAFVGTVTQGEETHIGLGALHGTLIVGATLAGYDSTPDNVAKLLSLTRKEDVAAKAVVDRNVHGALR